MCHLLYDQWIDITRRDGTRIPIAPYEITDGPESNPIVAIDAIRPDFNGALVQFLIGLVQTAMPPASEAAWRKGLLTPPSKDELLGAFEPYAEAFVFDGDGARFMQEIDLHTRTDLQPDNYWNVNKLLLDSPTEGRDLFSKFNPAPKFCVRCAAQALFTLQVNTPGFGRGHLSCVRHGGPVTSLIRGTTLWETVWFNTLVESTFYGNRRSSRHDISTIFPWLGESRISRVPGRDAHVSTSVEDVDPLQVYWPMALRIRLIHDEGAEGVCDLCGTIAAPLVSRFITMPYGTQYSGVWHHPLTPHQFKQRRDMPAPTPEPIAMAPFWIGYRRWLGLVQTDAIDPGLRKEPATAVLQHRLRQREYYQLMHRYRTTLHVFGYHQDHAKTRCYYDGEIPLFPVESAVQREFDATVEGMIQAASMALVSLKKAILQAQYDADPEKAALLMKARLPSAKKGKSSPRKKTLSPAELQKAIEQSLPEVDTEYWAAGERDFYSSILRLPVTIVEGEEEINQLKIAWVRTLSGDAGALFRRHGQTAMIGQADPKKIAFGYRTLRREISIYNPALREKLGLVENPPALSGNDMPQTTTMS